MKMGNGKLTYFSHLRSTSADSDQHNLSELAYMSLHGLHMASLMLEQKRIEPGATRVPDGKSIGFAFLLR